MPLPWFLFFSLDGPSGTRLQTLLFLSDFTCLCSSVFCHSHSMHIPSQGPHTHARTHLIKYKADDYEIHFSNSDFCIQPLPALTGLNINSCFPPFSLFLFYFMSWLWAHHQVILQVILIDRNLGVILIDRNNQ